MEKIDTVTWNFLVFSGSRHKDQQDKNGGFEKNFMLLLFSQKKSGAHRFLNNQTRSFCILKQVSCNHQMLVMMSPPLFQNIIFRNQQNQPEPLIHLHPFSHFRSLNRKFDLNHNIQMAEIQSTKQQRPTLLNSKSKLPLK